MEEDELTFVERNVATGYIAPGCIGRTRDIAGEPLGCGFLLIVKHFNILSFANEQCLGFVNHDGIDGIGVRGSIVCQGNLERFREVTLRAAGGTACCIFATLYLEGCIGQINTAVGSH